MHTVKTSLGILSRGTLIQKKQQQKKTNPDTKSLEGLEGGAV